MTIERGPGTGFSPAGRTVIMLAATAVAVIGLHLGRDLVTPALFAMVVVVTVHPVRGKLLKRGFPDWAAATAVVVVSWLVLLAILTLVLLGIAQFNQMIRDYGSELSDATAAAAGLLHGMGISVAEPSGIDPKVLLAAVAWLTGAVATLVIALAFVFTYILFMAFDARLIEGMTARFAKSHKRTITAFARYGSSVRRYYVINTIFGTVVAILDGLILWALGVPGAAAWMVLAFVTNYIPSIGFVIGLIPPLVLALVTGGWGTALVVLAAYCAINLVLQALVQPKFVSDAVQLNLTLTFFSVVFWSTVLGPAGAILSIPMTLLVRVVVLETDARTTFARWLTGDKSPG
ncbi:AI-2E family transporter [Paeniglutamicibacter kerguelensis]|uniref:PurR-regulated permease PerM n=1 Tax=Paeniglutamicibacter kerguelensis TaxID=254788 RepID=A0ABS4X9Z3_9MICC|nr:AI-2E family transporter [Paeniglutamicibacter kerguelensis]MBP2385188.1 putative PurR-regulated permease PerM [Paeniglutamicibacter kerguelensis]